MKYITFLLVFFVACSTVSVCDDLMDPSMICDMSRKLGIMPEDAVKTIIVANEAAIMEGLYTSSDVYDIAKKGRDLVAGVITNGDFIRFLAENAGGNKRILKISYVFFDGWPTDELMLEKDRLILSDIFADLMMLYSEL